MQPPQIVATLRANSEDAPQELFAVYGEQLIAYCWQSLRNEDATLTAVRDTLIVAQAHAKRLRDPDLLGPWLLALAEVECARRKPAVPGTPGEDAGEAPGAPPSAAGMRDEILACFDDPGQARYRAVAADRVQLGTDGFPAVTGSKLARWARRPSGRLNTGMMAAGVAAAAAFTLAAAVVWVLTGPKAARPAPAPAVAGAAASPALGNSPMPQVLPAAGMRQPMQSANPARSVPGLIQRALDDVSSQAGPSARPSEPGPVAPPGPPAASPSSMPSPQPTPSWQPSMSPTPTTTQPTPAPTTSSPSPTPSTASPTPVSPQPSTPTTS
jgi:hypothetical protein